MVIVVLTLRDYKGDLKGAVIDRIEARDPLTREAEATMKLGVMTGSDRQFKRDTKISCWQVTQSMLWTRSRASVGGKSGPFKGRFVPLGKSLIRRGNEKFPILIGCK